MLIIMLQNGTRLVCTSSLGLVILIQWRKQKQDGCTMKKVYNGLNCQFLKNTPDLFVLLVKLVKLV